MARSRPCQRQQQRQNREVTSPIIRVTMFALSMVDEWRENRERNAYVRQRKNIAGLRLTGPLSSHILTGMEAKKDPVDDLYSWDATWTDRVLATLPVLQAAKAELWDITQEAAEKEELRNRFRKGRSRELAGELAEESDSFSVEETARILGFQAPGKERQQLLAAMLTDAISQLNKWVERAGEYGEYLKENYPAADDEDNGEF